MPDETQTETVTTMDGESVAVNQALTLNRERLIKAKKAARNPQLAYAVQCLLDGMHKHPSTYAVSSPETPKATRLAAYIESISLPVATQAEVPPMWVPYADAYKGWADWKARQSAREPTPESAAAATDEAVARAMAKAKDEADKRAQRAASEVKTATGLNEFVTDEVRTERDKSTAERTERRVDKKEHEEFLAPFIAGQGCADDNGRPTKLTVGGKTLQLSDFEALAKRVGGAKAELLDADCAVCGAKHTLGETRSWTKRKDDGTVEQKTDFVLRQIWLPARTTDGGTELVNWREPNKGKPRNLPVVVCRSCGSIATQSSPKVLYPDGTTKPAILPTDCLPKFLIFLATRKERQSSQGRLVASATPEGQVVIHDQPVRKTRSVGPSKGPASGPIGEASSTGASVNPERRDEHFVDASPPTASRINSALADQLRAKAGVKGE